MNKQDFLNLPVLEQTALVSSSGVLLISFDKDDVSVSFYRLDHLFIKTTSNLNGQRHLEVHTAQDVLKLTPVIGDPANLFLHKVPTDTTYPVTCSGKCDKATPNQSIRST